MCWGVKHQDVATTVFWNRMSDVITRVSQSGAAVPVTWLLWATRVVWCQTNKGIMACIGWSLEWWMRVWDADKLSRHLPTAALSMCITFKRGLIYRLPSATSCNEVLKTCLDSGTTCNLRDLILSNYLLNTQCVRESLVPFLSSITSKSH